MNYLLDTNVLSEIRKGDRAHPGLRAWFDATPGTSMFTSVLVLGELRRGAESKRRRDPVAGTALDAWIRGIEESFAHHLLPIDEHVADRWGRLNVPDPLPVIDGLIGATALHHDMTVVTGNVRDLGRTGCRLLNPFAG